MSKLRSGIGLYLLLGFVGTVPCAFAKDKITITVGLGATDENVVQRTYVIPGTNGYTSSNCNGSATVVTVGATATVNGNSNCNTTITAATAPMVGVVSIEQALVDAVMPNGKHVLLTCLVSARNHCGGLAFGSYSAEVHGDHVWVFDHDINGKEYKIKYHVVGGAATYK